MPATCCCCCRPRRAAKRPARLQALSSRIATHRFDLARPAHIPVAADRLSHAAQHRQRAGSAGPGARGSAAIGPAPGSASCALPSRREDAAVQRARTHGPRRRAAPPEGPARAAHSISHNDDAGPGRALSRLLGPGLDRLRHQPRGLPLRGRGPGPHGAAIWAEGFLALGPPSAAGAGARLPARDRGDRGVPAQRGADHRGTVEPSCGSLPGALQSSWPTTPRSRCRSRTTCARWPARTRGSCRSRSPTAPPRRRTSTPRMSHVTRRVRRHVRRRPPPRARRVPARLALAVQRRTTSSRATA